MRALLARPWKAVPLVGGNPPLPVPVQLDTVYELITDAQAVSGSAVTYPLCFVVDGNADEDLTILSMLPFHKLRSAVLRTTSNSLLIACATTCNVWIFQHSSGPILRLPVPGGAGCGCKKCKAKEHDDDDDGDGGCGCSACKAAR